MLRRVAVLTIVAVAVSGWVGARAEEAVPDDDAGKSLYTLGVVVAQRMGVPFLHEDEIAIVQAGIADSLLGRDLRVDPADYLPGLTEFLAGRLDDAVKEQRDGSTALLARAAGEAGAVKLDSGVIYTELRPGDGEAPRPGGMVAVQFRGTLFDGRMFDHSETSGPSIFKLDDLVDCFREGLLRMRVGGASRLICPPDTAYGEQGNAPRILPGAALTFDVQLIDVVAEPPGGSGG